MVNLAAMRNRGRVLRALLALGLWLAAAAAFAQQLAPIPPMDTPVVDTTGTLDATARAGLEAQARALQQRKGSQLQVLMVASTRPEEIDQYAVRAFEQFKLGRKGVDDGVLLVVAKDDRRVRIEVGYGLEGAITDAQSGRIIQEYLAPKFRSGDYAGGLIDATAALTRLIDGEPLPEPMAQGGQGAARGDGGGNWVMVLVLAIVGSSLIRGMFGGVSALLRGAIGGIGAGVVAWLLAMSWGFVALAVAAGFFFSLFGRGGGHYAGSGGWGGYGGGWGGGSGGGGGGGWSGGGGSSGGGGASGSW